MRQWTVKDVMTTDVVTVRTDTPYSELVNTLATNKISAVPVLDAFNRVVGVVSEADLLHKVEFIGADTEPRYYEWGTRRTNKTKARGSTADELMSKPAETIYADTSVVVAAKRMEEGHIKRLPVVDELGHLIGIVSRRDLLKMYLRPDLSLRRDIVEDVLRRIMWIDPHSLDIQVADGIVTLGGQVDRKTTAEITVHLVKTVPGVIAVVDQLVYAYDDTAVSSGL